MSECFYCPITNPTPKECKRHHCYGRLGRNNLYDMIEREKEKRVE